MTLRLDHARQLLDTDDFAHYIQRFSALDREDIVNLIPNSGSLEWIKHNAPLFSCPDKQIEEIYYYRWWTFRKHIKATPAGTVVTEFISPVRHAGAHNTISCALGFHIAEGRWLRDQSFLDEYIRFWFRGDKGTPQPHFHKYSQWTAAAMLDRFRVTGDSQFIIDLLPDLIGDYGRWEDEKRRPDGLFWQFDVWDGMEESISGSRKHRNARPTINSYMYGNALAIAEIAEIAERTDLAATFREKATELKRLVQDRLWDDAAQFFKAQTEEGPLSDAREAIGFVPWCFNLPDGGFEQAWTQLTDAKGFWAPFGITTAEQRHPRFRSHGAGQCEWDGAVWPFATSQTLTALANLLRHYDQPHVSRDRYLRAMQTYARSHQFDGKPYIGEYLDETTGAWLKGDNPRSRYYNHSIFCDLVISGLVGLVPRSDHTVQVSPLLPSDSWDWFCLDNVSYHGTLLSIIWDRDGSKYDRGSGLSVFVNDQRIAHAPDLATVTGKLP